jgi:hypothetical protein
MDVVSIDGEQVALDRLRKGLRDRVASYRTLVLQITGEEEIPDWLADYPPLVDNLREDAPGYSFLGDPRFSNAHLPLLRRLVESEEWRIGMLDHSGRWVWNPSAMLRFLTLTGKATETVMPPKEFQCGKRSTELGDAKIRNTCARLRNLYILHQRMLFTSLYTKTSNLTGQDSFLPTQISENISRTLLHHLAVIRPVEVILSRVLWGDDVAALYDTYLYVSRGRRIDSKENSEILGAFFRETCGANIQLNRCRQLSATIAREFIDERFLTAHRRSDKGMGHSAGITKNHYSRDHDMFDFATSDELYEQRWVDTQYQAVLGFSNLPPPVALRLRGAPTEERLSEMITGTVKIAFQALASELKQSLAQALVGEMHKVVQTEVQAMLQVVAGASQSSTAAEPPTSMGPVQRLNTNLPVCVATAPSRDGRVHQSSSTTEVPDSDPPLGSHDRSGVRNRNRTPSMAPARHPVRWLPLQAALSPPVPDSDPPPSNSTAWPLQGRRQPSQPNNTSRLPSLQPPSPSPGLPSSSWTSSSSSPAPETYFQQVMGEVVPEPPIDSMYDKLLGGSRSSAIGEDFDWEMLDSEVLIAGTSSPMAPIPPTNRNQREDVREQVFEAFRKLYGPDARPKSQAQLELCEAVIQKSFNVIAVLPTGAGKSAAWLVPAVVLPRTITVVVVPFERLLSQHLRSAQNLGIYAIHWRAGLGSNVPKEVKILFMAVESFTSLAFVS